MPKGKQYLMSKLGIRKQRVQLKYKYYDQKDAMNDQMSVALPKYAKSLTQKVGWIQKAVDSLTNRLVFNGLTNDSYDFESIFDANNKDILFPSMFKGAIISGCDFVYISKDENGQVRLQCIDGAHATGILDPITNLLSEGYAELDTDEYGQVVLDAYFTKGYTEITNYQDKTTIVYENSCDFPLLVPIIYNQNATRPFGKSLVSRACMQYVDDAKETLRLQNISAQFYSYPQKYVLGMSNDADMLDAYKASISSFLNITRDDDGNIPTIGQFTQQSMSPYSDQLKTIASLFAGETGLTLDDLGFVTENPSSAEAIKAAHENLRLMARSAQLAFAVGVLNVGYIARCYEDDFMYNREIIRDTKVKWLPIFEADSTMLSGLGDGLLKINQAVPNYVTKETLEDITGIMASKEAGEMSDTTEIQPEQPENAESGI